MAFKQVFYALREVFPQVDLRILKAVASQYSSDVDAAVEFVLSDVLPAVSEPTETHYKLQDVDYVEHDHTNSKSLNYTLEGSHWQTEELESMLMPYLLHHLGAMAHAIFTASPRSNGTFSECKPFTGYDGPLCSDNKLEECSHVEDKVVINETRTAKIVLDGLLQDHYAQVGSSSTSAGDPPVIEGEQSASGACVDHCAPKKDKVASKAQNIGNHKHFSNNELPDLLATSGSSLPLYMHNPSDCAVIYEREMPSELFKAENKYCSSMSEDNYYLDTLFVNLCSSEAGQGSKNLPDAPTVHTLSKSEDNYDLQLLFQKEVTPKLSEAEGIHDFSKPDDNHNLGNVFLNFCSTEDGYISKYLPTAPTIRTCSKAEDNYDLQILFEDFDNAGKELDVLHTAENPSELDKSENDDSFYNLFGEPCATDSTPQVPFDFHGKNENEQPLDKVDNQRSLFDLFASSKIISNSLHISGEKHNSRTTDNEEQLSMDFKNSGTSTSTCSDVLNLSKLFSSTQNAPLSDLDSKDEVRDQTEKEVRCSNTLDEHFACPIVELDPFLPNGKKMMPSAYTSEEFLDISSRSYHTTEINKYISDFTKSKEALSSLSESATLKMKEVELQEENSRQAKQDAAKAHQYFLAMVEHFNQLIENSKESNDKQAQVLCEEKSSLAALAQDLQSQLTKLSAQRDEALATVQEVKFELDARLATSMNEEAAARNQIIQEEKLALLTRKEKEATVENIMEESRKLQKKAKENNLLRGLLLDHGRSIDLLQEEISSIHANVVALKERAGGNNLKSALMTTSCSVSSHTDDCKSASVDREQCLEKHESRNALSLDTVDCDEKEHVASSDDEWEVLEANQA